MLRRSLVVVARPGRPRLGPCCGSARRHPRQGEDADDLRADNPTIVATTPLDALQRCEGGRSSTRRDRLVVGNDVDHIGSIPAPASRLGLQGERRLAAGRRRPGAAEGRRHVERYYADLRPERRPADVVLSKTAANRDAATAQGDTGGRTTPAAPRLPHRRRTISAPAGTHRRSRSRTEPPGRPPPAPSAPTGCRDPTRRRRRRRRRAPRRLRRRRGSGKATLWVTRTRGSRCSSSAPCLRERRRCRRSTAR